MGMLEARGDLDLLEKALGTEDRGELRVQDLECNPAAVPNVLRQVDRSHAAGPELALDAVAIDERCRDAFGHCSHAPKMEKTQYSRFGVIASCPQIGPVCATGPRSSPCESRCAMCRYPARRCRARSRD